MLIIREVDMNIILKYENNHDYNLDFSYDKLIFYII